MSVILSRIPGSDSCRTIQFIPHIRDKALQNHLIRSVQVPDKNMCEVRCYEEPNCVSYNYDTAANATPLCELNDRNHLQVSGDDFVLKQGYIYRQILVRNRTYISVIKYIFFTAIHLFSTPDPYSFTPVRKLTPEPYPWIRH